MSDAMAAAGAGDNCNHTSSPRRRTLKDRIKRNMANDSLASSVTSAHSSGNGGGCGNYNHRREESVLAAASALASFGVTSPISASSCGNGSHADASSREQDYMSSAIASFASRSHGQDSMLFSSGLTSIRPPPIVDAPSPSSIPPPSAPGQPYEVEIEELSSVGRPFASLLGSDIPLTFPQKVSVIYYLMLSAIPGIIILPLLHNSLSHNVFINIHTANGSPF